MTGTRVALSDRSLAVPARLLMAGLITGLSDITFANAVATVRRGAFVPARVFQSVASGVLGPASFDGGMESARLGAALHFAIALIWTTLFFGLTLWLPSVRRATERTKGVALVASCFGMSVWLAMNFVVIPLSRARVTPIAAPVFWIMLFGHALFVGLPIVLGTRWARQGARA